MRHKIFTGGMLLAILSLTVSCTEKEQKIVFDKDLIKAEIQEIENKFAAGFNSRNIDSITYYADNAISYFAGQEPIVGIDAILQHLEEEITDLPAGARVSFETKEIYVTDDGDNVAEIGRHKLVDSTGATLASGHYFSFFAKIDGRYVCIRDMANSVRQMDDSLDVTVVAMP